MLIAIFLAAFLCSAAGAQTEPGPSIPPDAQEKAMQALKKLGPDRGALKLSAKVVRIIGVVSEINMNTTAIQKDLKDLNATMSDTEIKIAMAGDVLFDFDKWNVRQDAENQLNKVIQIIAASKSTEITISGHTDSRGGEEYNLKLSRQRAESVRNWIVSHSAISESSLKISGYGETRPVAPNQKEDGADNPDGRQKNRRVEFSIKILKK